ncbi:MAG TPA: LytTR family DNA-binding domain-containing protein [Saprospiraceae bacterium]|nr:LytTR family DNA-binding domain-containing protein [Saprospiraceae bacterium]
MEQKKSPTHLNKLCFSEGTSKYLLPYHDVIYFKSDSNYCHIIGRDQKYFICQTLKWVSRQLPLSQFIRVHHRYAVNIDDIKSLNISTWNIEISTGEYIPVSRTNRAAVRELFQTKSKVKM